jgi:predicted Fe-Mo cluster-binding NifX family protein
MQGVIKIAVPVWEGKVSPVFDTATRLLVVQMEGRREMDRFTALLREEDPSRRCLYLKGIGVDTLICGAISRPFYEMLSASGLKVVAWITGSPDRVIEAWLNGCLLRDEFIMPGCSHDSLHVKG